MSADTLHEDCTAENISQVFAETLQQWKLEDNRLVGIATDSEVGL